MTHNKDSVTFSIGENEKNDNTPHHLFCEMDELQANSEWKESARWLKFEEDVDDGGRWSKPHVATLSLHSLLELRSCLTNGAIFLDFLGDDLTVIVGNIYNIYLIVYFNFIIIIILFLLDSLLDNVVDLKMIDVSKREFIRNALLLKHVHQHEKEFQKQISNGEKKSLFKKSSNANMNEVHGKNFV